MALLDEVSVSAWQDMFTSIIEDADSNILLLDEDFRILTLNPGFYWIFLETYGIELKKGSSIMEAMEKVDGGLTREWKNRCLVALAGSTIKVEEAFEIDGRVHYWEIHFKASGHPGGPSVISIFSRDITVRKAYQKKILENEANLRSILNTIDDSIWLVNSSLELIDFNKEFYKRCKQAFGIRLQRGANVLEMIPESFSDLKEQWRVRYDSGLRGRPGKYIDTLAIDKELNTIEVKVYPIVEDGEVCGLTIYARDITVQTRTENLLKEQNEELIKINAELDRFVYSASHDLRAPLMSVKGLLNMIKLDPDRSNADHYLELIEQSVKKLDTFIIDIINYSRNSRMEVIGKQINFDELLTESIDSLKFMEGAEQVRSIREINTVHPFYSDYSRLLIIFNNIISNAVRYRDPRKTDSFLRITVETNREQVTIRFEDNGIGIHPDYQENIFKMFFRASAESKGSGLGLYIVKGVVEKMRGTITVQSSYGKSTVFTITIPNLGVHQEC